MRHRPRHPVGSGCESCDTERAAKNAREAAAARALNPSLPAYVPGVNPARTPRPPQGPSGKPPTPHVADGLELAGQSLQHRDGQVVGGWDLARRAGNADPAPPPPDFALRRLATMQRGDGSEAVRWQAWDRSAADMWAAFETAVARAVAGVPALPAVAVPTRVVEDFLGVLKVSDAHLGMLAWGPETGADHDLSIGIRDLRTALHTLIDRTPPCARFLLAVLGDFFHAQDDDQKTPRSGHKLDVDTRFAKVFEYGLALLRDAIDYALARFGRVRVVYVPGNHDPKMAFLVAAYLRAWYRNEPRVDIDTARKPFAYEVFGANLLGFAHGPSVTRPERLPGVMATDMAEAWGLTRHREWITGDIHHDSAKEHPGVTIYSHKILAPKDAWHDASGYRSSQGLSLTTYHRDFGRELNRTITLEEVRALQAKEDAA
jgi:hypothetical protein